MADRLSITAPYDGGFANGGVGVIARRQQDPILSGLADAAAQIGLPGFGPLGNPFSDPHYQGLIHAAENYPLRLLRALLGQDGTATMAAGIEASLAYGARNVRPVVIKDWEGGRGTVDDDATAELDRVLCLYQAGDLRASISDVPSLPGIKVAPSPVPAGLPMLLHSTDRLNDTGQVVYEATGDIGIGVTGIYDVDALRCRYRDAESRRDDGRHVGGIRKKSFRVFEQENKDAKKNEATGAVDGWQILNSAGIVSVAWKASTDNPYGFPRNGAALAYLLRKVSRRRDLSDWLHGSALPRVIVEQLVKSLMEIASEYPELCKDLDGNSIQPGAWVALQQQISQQKMMAASTDRVQFMGEGRVYPVNPSNISGLTDVLQMERIEEIQSLNMLPSLVGVTDGGTQAYAEVQWLALTKGLGLLADYAAAPITQIGNYHFRLLGENLIVQMEYENLPPIDPDKKATADLTNMERLEHLAAIGVISPEYFARAQGYGGVVNIDRLKEHLDKKNAALTMTGTGAGTA